MDMQILSFNMYMYYQFMNKKENKYTVENLRILKLSQISKCPDLYHSLRTGLRLWCVLEFGMSLLYMTYLYYLNCLGWQLGNIGYREWCSVLLSFTMDILMCFTCLWELLVFTYPHSYHLSIHLLNGLLNIGYLVNNVWTRVIFLEP